MFFLIVILAGLGGTIANRMKVPAGFLIGSIVVTAVTNLIYEGVQIPTNLTLIVQIGAGALLGIKINKEDIYALKRIILPSIILVFGMILLNAVIGFIIHHISGMDLVTALLASAPGGVTEMSIIAVSMGADPSMVAFIQLIRVLSVMIVSPFIIKKLCKEHLASEADKELVEHIPGKDEKLIKRRKVNIGLTMTLAIILGSVGSVMPIPAGALVFSMLGAATLNIILKRGEVFKYQRSICQVLAGMLIGSKFTLSGSFQYDNFALVVLVMVFGIVLLNVIIGILISKLGKLDLPTALFSSVPGGMTDISLISKEFGADQTKVVVMQFMRLVNVIALFPTLIMWLVSL